MLSLQENRRLPIMMFNFQLKTGQACLSKSLLHMEGFFFFFFFFTRGKSNMLEGCTLKSPFSMRSTLWGTYIHRIKNCDLSENDFFERWDHEEDLSVSLKGSNPPFFGVKLLLGANVFGVIDTHRETRLNIAQTLLQEKCASNCSQFQESKKKNECREDKSWMNINTFMCVASVFVSGRHP